jgi:hypothetical protein
MTFLAGFIVIAVKVSSILIGCVRPAPANRRWCRPRRGGVRKIWGPAEVSAVLEWQGGGGEGHGFSYLLESHMTYLAGSHILRSWLGIWLTFRIVRPLLTILRQTVQSKRLHHCLKDALVPEPPKLLGLRRSPGSSSDSVPSRGKTLVFPRQRQFLAPLVIVLACRRVVRGSNL